MIPVIIKQKNVNQKVIINQLKKQKKQKQKKVVVK